MKINKIDHICVAVKNLDEARKLWEPFLGKDKPDDEYVDDREKIRVARYMLGEVGFQLMESTSLDGDVAKFIEKRGEGVMLISFNVDNTREAAKNSRARVIPSYRTLMVKSHVHFVTANSRCSSQEAEWCPD